MISCPATASRIGHIAEKMPAHRGRNFLVRKGKDLEERFIGNAYMFTPEERKALLKIRTNAPDPMAITKRSMIRCRIRTM